MSQAQLDKFITLVCNDPAVLQEASRGAEEAEQFIRHTVQYAKDRGYDFGEEEARAWVIEQGKQRAAGELSDTQLEAVAGGKGGGYAPSPYLNRTFINIHSGLAGNAGGALIGNAGAAFRGRG